MTKTQSTIRDWLIAEDLKENPGYRVADSAGDVPEGYGSYSAYDGIQQQQFGLSRNLRGAFENCRHRLSKAEIPIFRWKPDTDRSVRAYLDHDHGDDPRKECSACGGEGTVSA